MSAIQLRRYEIDPEFLDRFLAWWPGIVDVRKKYGFSVVFAVADRENSEFVWALRHDGDFAAAEKLYFDSPERTAVFVDNPGGINVQHVSMVDAIYGI